MIKEKINICLSILFSIVLFITIFCLTVLNANFIKINLKKSNYYNVVYNNIINDLKEYDENLIYTLDIKDVEDDINEYVKSRYSNKYFISKIETDISNNEIRDIYNKNIKFNNLFINYNMVLIIYSLFSLDIILIIITGIIFKKTKNKHNIRIILILSSIISFIIYGICYIFNNYNLDILYNIFNNYLHIYLAINIIILECIIIKKIKVR